MSETVKKLYSRGQVVLSVVIGGPLAGATVIGLNFNELGHRKTAEQSVLIGVLATVLLTIVALMLPEEFPAMIMPVVSIFAMVFWYSRWQEPVYLVHEAEGGAKASWGLTVIIGVISMFITMAIALGLILLLPGGLPS